MFKNVTVFQDSDVLKIPTCVQPKTLYWKRYSKQTELSTSNAFWEKMAESS